MKYLFALLTPLLFISCNVDSADPNKQIDEGQIEDNIYHSDDVGWTMSIPEGWTITTMEQTDENLEKGSEIFEEELGMKVDYSTLNNLLAFQKNQVNNFSSNSQFWEEEESITWSGNNAALKLFLMETFEGQGLAVDSSITRTEDIGGVAFQTYSFSFRDPEGNPLFKQKMYSSLINGYDFSANLMYNNEKDKNEMFKAWEASTFE